MLYDVNYYKKAKINKKSAVLSTADFPF